MHSLTDMTIRRNGQDCLGDFKNIGVYMRDFLRIDTSKPLFLLTDVPSVNPRVWTAVQLNLRKAGYKIILPGPATARLPREVRAILYYYMSLGSDIFIGNAVSTFAAALIMQRRQLGRYEISPAPLYPQHHVSSSSAFFFILLLSPTATHVCGSAWRPTKIDMVCWTSAGLQARNSLQRRNYSAYGIPSFRDHSMGIHCEWVQQ